jgi:DNA-binding LacI/PurR family transcriptional regulator
VQAKTSSKVESVYRILEEKILKGDWPVGGVIPSEVELLRELDCGRSTIGTAIAKLVHEGLVERRKRAGTRVLRNSIERDRPRVELDAFAFIYPSEKHETSWRAVSGFQDAARDSGRRTITLTTGADHRKDSELFGRLGEFDVKGVVLYPSLSTAADYAHFSNMLLAPKFPVVLTINFPGYGHPSVVVDGFHAGYTMTKHLIKKGAKRIGYLSNDAWVLQMRDRYLGYLWALEEAGLREPENGVMLESTMHPNIREPFSEPREIAKRFLEAAGKLEAVMCANDFLAIGLATAALDAGYVLPGDLLIAGIDDLSVSATASIALTTYRIPWEERGRAAFQLLENLVAGNAPERMETRIRGEIVIRESA